MSRTDSTITLTEAEKVALLAACPAGLVAVDLETTGLSPLVDKIIEIAAVKLDEFGELTSFHQMINPLIEIPAYTIAIHKITNAMVENSPTLKRPLRSFWEFVGHRPIWAHNAVFDAGFLIRGSHEFQLDVPPTRIFDSCRLARAVYKGMPDAPADYKLSTLADFFAIPLQHHVAIDDTYACMKITANALMKLTSEEERKEKLERSYTLALSQYDGSKPYQFPKRLELLKDYIIEKKPLEILYSGGTLKKEHWRPVRPVALLPMPKGPVLMAQDLHNNQHKSFVLKKIKDVRELKKEAHETGQ